MTNQVKRANLAKRANPLSWPRASSRQGVAAPGAAGMALVALLALGAPAPALAVDAPAAMKIGYVDLQKAIQETSAGKKAKKELEKEFNSKKEELQKKEADLKKMNEDLEKKKAVHSEEAHNRKTAEFQQEMVKYRELVGQSQMNIQKKERELTQPILEKLQEQLDKLAKDRAYTMVLEKSEQSVLWARKDLDLTDDLVKAFEKSAESKSSK
jgi:outer membrane protein